MRSCASRRTVEAQPVGFDRAIDQDPSVSGNGTTPAETTPVGKEIVGREEELARIAEFAAASVHRPAALVVQGEAGIGKTTLWRAGVGALEGAGCRVLRSAPAASEASLPLSTLTDLLEPVYA